MPESSLWTLVITLAILAFGLTLKIADMRRTVKNLQKEIDTARSENKTLDDKFNKDISDIKEFNQRRIYELTETISNLQFELSQKNKFMHYNKLLWLSDDPTPFCPRCHEADNKPIHMTLEEIKPFDAKSFHRYNCPQCTYFANYSKHPNGK